MPEIMETVQEDTPDQRDNLNSSDDKYRKPTSATSERLEQDDEKKERRMTPFERLSYDLANDSKCQKEITLGKRIGFYRIRGELGTGNFSQVKLGIHALTKEKVAIKILDKTKLDQKTQRLLSREISSMEKLHHPHIIRLYEVIETLAKLHIVMEYAGGGELFTKVTNEGKLPGDNAKIIFSQICAAVKHMHEKNIIHRDLKAENVFYAGQSFVKVGDFGFSTNSTRDQTLNTFCGSPPYAAPELFRDENYYGVFVDIWALGIMLFFIMTGIMPFRADTVSKLKKCILDGTYNIPSYISDSCQFLIRNILKPVPQDRFTLQEILRSDWMEGHSFPEAYTAYNLIPSHDNAGLSEDEIETKRILNELGISNDNFKQSSTRDSRSNVIGTYRIVLHKVQKKRSGYLENSNETEADINRNQMKQYNYQPVQTNKQSKFCVIL